LKNVFGRAGACSRRFFQNFACGEYALGGASSKKGHHEGVLLLVRVDKKDANLFFPF